MVDLTAQIEYHREDKSKMQTFLMGKFHESEGKYKRFRIFHENVLIEYEKEKEKYVSENLRLKKGKGNNE